MTIEIGRLEIKIAGRDAGCKCVIIDILDDNYVLIDGETRRRRCNILHLEPLNQILNIQKDATHGDVARVLKEIEIEARQTKPKIKTERPKKKRKTPEQLRVQKVEKKKFRDLFSFKKKEEKVEEKKEGTLEEKAGISEENKEESNETKEELQSGLKITSLETEEINKEKPKEKIEKKEIKKATGKKTTSKKE